MTKKLYKQSTFTEDNDTWIFKYYLTRENYKTPCGSSAYNGIMITSECNGKYYENCIWGLFPFMHDAKKFIKFLFENEASPISLPYMAIEYIENYFVKDVCQEDSIPYPQGNM